MTDLISKEKRSYIMSIIKGKNTKPEIIVRKYLFLWLSLSCECKAPSRYP